MKSRRFALPAAALVISAGALAQDLPPLSQEPSGAGGCWAQLHELPGFSGDRLTVAGPADLSAIARTLGGGWRPRSLALGPDARLQANDASGNGKITIGPGQQIHDLRNTEPPELLASIGDMKLDCAR